MGSQGPSTARGSGTATSPETGRDLSPRPLRVAAVNDYELVVAGLAAMLSRHPDRIEVAEAIVVGEPLAGGPVDVALYDSYGREGLVEERIEKLLATEGITHVVLYTLSWDEALVAQALALPLSGVVAKSVPTATLVEALEAIGRGTIVIEPPREGGRRAAVERDWPGRALGLSERESEVFVLLVSGKRNADIGRALYISIDTVKTHLRHGFRKLDVRTRSEAVAMILRDPAFRRWAP
jgi:NarL family two-component system response regulator LiaR